MPTIRRLLPDVLLVLGVATVLGGSWLVGSPTLAMTAGVGLVGLSIWMTPR